MVVITGKRKAEIASMNEIELKRMFFNIDDTVKESRQFMSRLLYVSFSLLLRSRGIIPDAAFKKGIIDGSVMSYIMDADHPIGLRVSNKLRGACLALKDGHLERLVLLLTEDGSDSTKAVEAISWKISYDPDGITSMALCSSEKDFCRLLYTGQDTVRDKTIAFLKLIQSICAQLRPVPGNVYASLRSMYTSDAPRGYQAEGFHDCQELYRMNPAANRHCVPGVITKYNRCWLMVDSVFLEHSSRSPSVVSHGGSSIALNSKCNTPAVETGYTIEKNFFDQEELEETRSAAPMTRSRKRTNLKPILENDSLEMFEEGADFGIDIPIRQADDTNIESPLENNTSIENNSSISSPDAEQITSPANPYSRSMVATDTIDVTPKRARRRIHLLEEDDVETTFVSDMSLRTPPPQDSPIVEDDYDSMRRSPDQAPLMADDDITFISEVRQQVSPQKGHIKKVDDDSLRRTPGRARFLTQINDDDEIAVLSEVRRSSQEAPRVAQPQSKKLRRTPGRAKFLTN